MNDISFRIPNAKISAVGRESSDVFFGLCLSSVKSYYLRMRR